MAMEFLLVSGSQYALHCKPLLVPSKSATTPGLFRSMGGRGWGRGGGGGGGALAIQPRSRPVTHPPSQPPNHPATQPPSHLATIFLWLRVWYCVAPCILPALKITWPGNPLLPPKTRVTLAFPRGVTCFSNGETLGPMEVQVTISNLQPKKPHFWAGNSHDDIILGRIGRGGGIFHVCVWAVLRQHDWGWGVFFTSRVGPVSTLPIEFVLCCVVSCCVVVCCVLFVLRCAVLCFVVCVAFLLCYVVLCCVVFFLCCVLLPS